MGDPSGCLVSETNRKTPTAVQQILQLLSKLVLADWRKGKGPLSFKRWTDVGSWKEC